MTIIDKPTACSLGTFKHCMLSTVPTLPWIIHTVTHIVFKLDCVSSSTRGLDECTVNEFVYDGNYVLVWPIQIHTDDGPHIPEFFGIYCVSSYPKAFLYVTPAGKHLPRSSSARGCIHLTVMASLKKRGKFQTYPISIDPPTNG